MPSSAKRKAERARMREEQERAQAAQRQQEAAPAPAPEPVSVPVGAQADEGGLRLARDLNFEEPPVDVFYAEGVLPHFPHKSVYFTPELGAHWQKFLMANPDLKNFNGLATALYRVLFREWEVSAQEARQEMRRTDKPVRPEPGPLLQEVREEYRMIKAEQARQKEAARKAD